MAWYRKINDDVCNLRESQIEVEINMTHRSV